MALKYQMEAFFGNFDESTKNFNPAEGGGPFILEGIPLSYNLEAIVEHQVVPNIPGFVENPTLPRASFMLAHYPKACNGLQLVFKNDREMAQDILKVNEMYLDYF